VAYLGQCAFERGRAEPNHEDERDGD
jgi:hypothetical protein